MEIKDWILLGSTTVTLTGVALAYSVFRHNVMHNQRQLKISKLEEMLETISKLTPFYESLRFSYEIINPLNVHISALGKILNQPNQVILNEREYISTLTGGKEELYNQLARIEILNNGYIKSTKIKAKIETLLELLTFLVLTIFGEIRQDKDFKITILNEEQFLYFIRNVVNDILSEMKLNAKLVTPKELQKYKANDFIKDYTNPNIQ